MNATLVADATTKNVITQCHQRYRVTKSGVIWRCRECVQEHGETGHTKSTMKVQEPTSDHKRRRTCLESMRRVREGGKDQWAEYAAFEGDRHDRGKNGEPEIGS